MNSPVIQRQSRWTINTGNGYADATLGLTVIVGIMLAATGALCGLAWVFT